MGNTISSIKSVVITSIKGVFSRYVEFSEKCSKYEFECKSFPVVQAIVYNGILFPCQVLVSSPIIIYGVVTNYPVTVASHCFTVFKLGAPFLSTQYVYTMALLRLGYNVPYFLYDLGEELSRKIENPPNQQDMDRHRRFWDNYWQHDNQYRQRMEILTPPIRYDPPPVVRPHPAPWEIRTWG